MDVIQVLREKLSGVFWKDIAKKYGMTLQGILYKILYKIENVFGEKYATIKSKIDSGEKIIVDKQGNQHTIVET